MAEVCSVMLEPWQPQVAISNVEPTAHNMCGEGEGPVGSHSPHGNLISISPACIHQFESSAWLHPWEILCRSAAGEPRGLDYHLRETVLLPGLNLRHQKLAFKYYS